MYEIEDIATLISYDGVATLGTDLFLYSAPAEVTHCTILFPSNDPPIIDPQTPFYLRGKFQTIVRASTYQDGFAKCKELAAALTKNNVDMPTIKIKEVRPLYQARAYRRSDSGALEFSVTYRVTYVQK